MRLITSPINTSPNKIVMSLMMYVPKAIIKKVVLTWNMQIYLKTSGSNMRIVLKLTTNISFFAVLIISLIHSIIFTLPLNMSDKKIFLVE